MRAENLTPALRKAMGIDPDETPDFFPAKIDDPDGFAWLGTAKVWMFCAGDAASPITILHGPESDGFAWVNTGQQFADYGCSWSKIYDAYDHE
jgi:hypothetical protein